MRDNILEDINNKIQSEEIKTNNARLIDDGYDIIEELDRLTDVYSSEIFDVRAAVFQEFQDNTMKGIQLFDDWEINRKNYNTLVHFNEVYDNLKTKLGRTPSYDELVSELGESFVAYFENPKIDHNSVDFGFEDNLYNIKQEIVRVGIIAFEKYRDEHLVSLCNQQLSKMITAFHKCISAIKHSSTYLDKPDDKYYETARRVCEYERSISSVLAESIRKLIYQMNKNGIEFSPENIKEAAESFNINIDPIKKPVEPSDPDKPGNDPDKPGNDPVNPNPDPSKGGDEKDKKIRLEEIILIFIQLSLDNNVLTDSEKNTYLLLVAKVKAGTITDEERFEYEMFRKRLIAQGIKLCTDVKLIQEYYILIQIFYPEIEFVTVTFRNVDGNELALLKFPKGEVLPFVPNAPTIENMEFAGWELQDKTLFDVTQPVNEDLDLTASYRDRNKVKVTFVDSNTGYILRESYVTRGELYDQNPPERYSDGKPLKPMKDNGKFKKTFRLQGWNYKNANGETEKFKLYDTPINEDMVLTTNYGFDWERVASTGLGALAAVGTIAMPGIVAESLLIAGAVGLGSGAVSWVMKNLIDHGVINKKTPITKVKTPSDKLRQNMRRVSNKLKDRYTWDNILHATAAYGVITTIAGVYEKIKQPQPDPIKTPEIVDPSYQEVMDTTNTRTFKDIDVNGAGHKLPNYTDNVTLDKSHFQGNKAYFVESKDAPGVNKYLKITPGQTEEEIIKSYQAIDPNVKSLDDLTFASFKDGILSDPNYINGNYGAAFGNPDYQLTFQSASEVIFDQAQTQTLNIPSSIANLIADFDAKNPGLDPSKRNAWLVEFITNKYGPQYTNLVPTVVNTVMRMS